jgi:hypothetical protein
MSASSAFKLLSATKEALQTPLQTGFSNKQAHFLLKPEF